MTDETNETTNKNQQETKDSDRHEARARETNVHGCMLDEQLTKLAFTFVDEFSADFARVGIEFDAGLETDALDVVGG